LGNYIINPTKTKGNAKCSKTQRATKARPMMSMSSYVGNNKHEKKKFIKQFIKPRNEPKQKKTFPMDHFIMCQWRSG
jgi:hypothetical protein